MKHLIIYAHPNPKSFSHAILETVQETLKKNKNEVVVRDLYAVGFNPVLSAGDLQEIQRGNMPEEIAAEQGFVRWANIMTFIYPVWWVGMPAIVKGYIDRIFSSGFAYAFKENGPVGLLDDKRAIIFNSQGSAEDVYKESGLREDMERIADAGIFEFCGIKVLEHKVFPSVILVDDATRKGYLEQARAIVQQYDREPVATASSRR